MQTELRRTYSEKNLRDIHDDQAGDIDESKFQQQIQELIDKQKLGNLKNSGSLVGAGVFGLLGFLIFSTTIFGGFIGLILGAGIGRQIGKKYTFKKRKYKKPLDSQEQYLLRATCLIMYCHQIRKNKSVNIETYSAVLEKVVLELNFAIENRKNRPYAKLVKGLKNLLKKDKSQVALFDSIINLQAMIQSFSDSRIHCKHIADRVWKFYLPVIQTLDQQDLPKQKQLESYKNLTEILNSPEIQQIVLKYPYQQEHKPITVIGVYHSRLVSINNQKKFDELKENIKSLQFAKELEELQKQPMNQTNISTLILKQRELLLRRCNSLPSEESSNLGLRKCNFKFNEKIDIMQKLISAQDIAPKQKIHKQSNQELIMGQKNQNYVMNVNHPQYNTAVDDEENVETPPNNNFPKKKHIFNHNNVQGQQKKKITIEYEVSLENIDSQEQSDVNIKVPLLDIHQNCQTIKQSQQNLTQNQKAIPFETYQQVNDQSHSFQTPIKPKNTSDQFFRKSAQKISSTRDVKLEFPQSDQEEENSGSEHMVIQMPEISQQQQQQSKIQNED